MLNYENYFESEKIIALVRKRRPEIRKKTYRKIFPILFGILLFLTCLVCYSFIFNALVFKFFFVFSCIWMISSIISYTILSGILKIEKYLWIYNFFNNQEEKELNSTLKKLLLHYWRIKIEVFLIYYLWIWVLFFGSLIMSFYLPVAMGIKYNPVIWVIFFIVLWPFVLFFYFYMLKKRFCFNVLLLIDDYYNNKPTSIGSLIKRTKFFAKKIKENKQSFKKLDELTVRTSKELKQKSQLQSYETGLLGLEFILLSAFQNDIETPGNMISMVNYYEIFVIFKQLLPLTD